MLENVLPTSVVQSVSVKAFDNVVSIHSENAGHKADETSKTGPTVSVVQVPDEPTPTLDLNATHIKSSPYTDPLNFLDLRPLDPQTHLFALALTHFAPIRFDYATADYMITFNFNIIFDILRHLCSASNLIWKRQDFYVVIFRSQLHQGADRARLGQLDQMSHQEACASGGLLHYWFGSPDGEMRNLATCIWRNREDAAAGGRGPWHRQARGAARVMYEEITFHTHKLVVEDGARKWCLEDHCE